jgi:hypothetical protein
MAAVTGDRLPVMVGPEVIVLLRLDMGTGAQDMRLINKTVRKSFFIFTLMLNVIFHPVLISRLDSAFFVLFVF